MDWKPDGDPAAVRHAARGEEPRAHPHQLHDLSPMRLHELDDNHEARAKDRKRRRSLPVVDKDARAPARARAEPSLWRSIEERDRVGATPGAANEFPGRGHRARRRRVATRVHADARRVDRGRHRGRRVHEAQREDRPVRAPARGGHAGQPAALRHRVCAGRLRAAACWSRATRVGRPRSKATPRIPQTIGATTAIDQALILGLYDDDRAKQLRRGTTPLAWRTLLAADRRHAARAGREPAAPACAS